MMLIRSLSILAAAALLAPAGTPGTPPPRPVPPTNPSAILIRGATLIDGVNPTPLANASVLIEGDRITRVDRRQRPAPRGTWVLDARGLYLVPGLIDMHVHATVQPAMFP